MSSFLQEVKGFTPVIDVVVKDLGLMPALVYGRMWRYCQMPNGVCSAALETVADYLGVSSRTVRRHAQTLCEAGYLNDLTPGRKNRPHAYADTGKVIIAGLVEARLAGQQEQTGQVVGQRVLPPTSVGRTESLGTRTESPSHSDRESDEDSLSDSLQELPVRQTAQAAKGDYFTMTEEPEYAGLEDDVSSPPRNPVASTPEQTRWLDATRAKSFQPGHKSKVKSFLASVKRGDAMAALQGDVMVYQQCLKELGSINAGSLKSPPSVLPRSWLEDRLENARKHGWTRQNLVDYALKRDSLVDHCQRKLRVLGGSAAEETVEEYAARTGKAVYRWASRKTHAYRIGGRMKNQQEWNDLLDKWSEIGAETARHDTWMVPCYKEDAGRAADLSDLVLTHRQQWESTDYFQILYSQEMLQDIVDALWEVGQVSDREAEHEARQDLLDAFWDAWEHEVGAYELAKKAMGAA